MNITLFGRSTILMLGLLIAAASPSCAQRNLPKFFRQILSQRPIARVLREASLVPELYPLEKMVIHQTIRQKDLMSLAPLFYPSRSITSPRPLLPAPPKIMQAVFTVQNNPNAKGKGSAFAVNINGTTWGVTARHVLDDIGRSPVLSVKDQKGNPLFFEFYPIVEGNIHGADVSLFKIPNDALPYISPLQIDDSLPMPTSIVQSAGFSHGNFGWFPSIEVLFASQHRILARYTDLPVISGYCGSPLLKNGKVIGVFVGITRINTAKQANWYRLLENSFQPPMNDFTQIVPIHWVNLLARQAQLAQQTQKHINKGVKFKALGKTIGILHSNENIHSIQQIRNGSLIKTIYAYPFMDYAHLERFFSLEPTDILRFTIQQGDRSSRKQRLFLYDFNIKTKEISLWDYK